MYKNIIFDLYGTLIDIKTDEGSTSLWEKLSLLMAYNGAIYTPEDLEDNYHKIIRKYMSRVQGTEFPDIDISDVFHKLYRLKNPKIKFRIAKQTTKAFRAMSTERLDLYDGVINLLDKLREDKVKLYILSNAQRIFLKPEMEILGIDGYFESVYISSDHHICKPDPNFMKILLDKEKLKVKDTLMIGNDYSTDIKVAKKVGMDSLYIQTELSNLKVKEEKATYAIMDGDHKKIYKLLNEVQ